MNFKEGAGKDGSLVVEVRSLTVLRRASALTLRLQLVDGLQLEVLVVHLAEDAVLIVATLSVHCIECRLHSEHRQFSRVLDLYQAVLVVIFENRLADALLEEGCVREDELAAFELGGVRWQ